MYVTQFFYNHEQNTMVCNTTNPTYLSKHRCCLSNICDLNINDLFLTMYTFSYNSYSAFTVYVNLALKIGRHNINIFNGVCLKHKILT